MPRSVSTPFSYQYPAGTAAVSGQPISSVAYNAALTDMTNNVFNAAWPVTYGGTGTADGSSLLPNGNASIPAIRFQSDTDTGFYWVSAGDIGVSINGVKVSDFTATGISSGAFQSFGTTVGFTGFKATLTENGVGEGPLYELFRDSASPAVNDKLGQVLFYGRNSAGNKQLYGFLQTTISDATDPSEDGIISLGTVVAGTLNNRVIVGSGLYTVSATSGDQGADTINAGSYYINGTPFGRPTLGTAQATTSGTTITFTGIPTWATWIRLYLVGVSTNGTSSKLVQIGSGSLTSTGYVGSNGFYGTSTTVGTFTNGLGIRSVLASDNVSAIVDIALVDSATHTYVMTCTATANTNFVFGSSSSIALSGVLDRVGLTTTGGDTFDAGLSNVVYF